MVPTVEDSNTQRITLEDGRVSYFPNPSVKEDHKDHIKDYIGPQRFDFGMCRFYFDRMTIKYIQKSLSLY